MPDRSSEPTVAHDNPELSGTTVSPACYCGAVGCSTPEQCRRDHYSSETTWREIAVRPALKKAAA